MSASASCPNATQDFLADLQDLENRVSETWDEFEEAQKRITDEHRKLRQILDRHRNLRESLSRLRAAYEDPDDIDAIKDNETVADDVQHRLTVLKSEMNGIGENRMLVGSLWLRLLVGKVSMKVWDSTEKVRLKSAYHQFKYMTNYLFLFFPILQLLWWRCSGEFSWVLFQWHSLFLIWYYVSMTTRELVLRLNGSKIHLWWIAHHQISAFSVLIMMLLMRSAYDRYIFMFEKMIWLTLATGILQLLLTRYQSKRHYVRLALGKAESVDVALSECIVNESNANSNLEFKILKSLCYAVYMLEFGLGIVMLCKIFISDRANGLRFDLFKFEAYMCGLCLVLLGCGNSYVLYSHERGSRYMKRSGSRSSIQVPRIKKSPACRYKADNAKIN